MGWGSGPRTWAEMERVLSGRPAEGEGDGGDSPAWARKRGAYRAPMRERGTPKRGYAELHAHSSYSFLDGASTPEEMAEEADRLGLEALALTDHDGFYGVVRFFEAARELGLKTVFGAELSLGDGACGIDRGRATAGARAGVPDPDGEHLLVLARGKEGYTALSTEIAAAHMVTGEKGLLRYDIDRLAARAAEGHWLVLTGCRKGAVRRALDVGGPAAAKDALARLVERYGKENVVVELTASGGPTDPELHAVLVDIAKAARLPIVATTGAHMAAPDARRLAQAMAAIRAKASMPDVEGWLATSAHLRDGDEMMRLVAYPEAIDNAVQLARDLAFGLELVAPNLPPFTVPAEFEDENDWLRHLVMKGAAKRYGAPAQNKKAYGQLEHELAVIEKLNFPGYFLVVRDIVQFCLESNILCQGRGSAANSAVCFALEVTPVDAIANDLLFERFLSAERDGPPDIDIDIESDRREEVIQYVYRRYGREYTAQVANVITYRGRSAVRDVARAFGYATGRQDAWAKQVGHWGGFDEARDVPEDVLHTAMRLTRHPRHLGIHSGGMVICDRPIAEVCPTEWARMPNRSVLQWDKDDCAAIGLVKFDLLGLGMLSALHYAIDLIKEHEGIEVDFAKIDLTEKAVYDMLQKADTVGVFQVESRAQMATLPRLKPTKFFDIVVEVAIIRPGPIQGGSVHPFIRRYNGEEKWSYDHESMKPALAKTYGVPLFQEQLMQLAVDVAGFTAAEADELRRAMGSKRSPERMERLKGRLFEGMERLNGITGDLAERIYEKLFAFANFGFPESHAQSFASLVFYSAWLKLHHPAAFCAALLRAQPMGFYSPQSLVADARRHGVTVRGPDINRSNVDADLEDAGASVRLGLATVRHIGTELAERIVADREAGGPFASAGELSARVGLDTRRLEALATAGALDSVTTAGGGGRRRALWEAGAAALHRPGELPLHAVMPPTTPHLPGLSAIELAAADVWATGITPDCYPTEFLRTWLDEQGVVKAGDLPDREKVADGSRILVGGAVTHRQRPATAGGVTFLNLEDETGMVNVLCTKGVWTRYRDIAQEARALLIRGVVQNATGAVTVVADKIEPLDLKVAMKSRNWQ